MSNSRKIGRNSSFGGIRYAPSNKELSDANERKETSGVPINIDALRSIKRIVETIRGRIDEAKRNAPANANERCGAGDSSGSKTVSADSGKDHIGEEEKR